MHHHPKMMWTCAGAVVLAIVIAAIAGLNVVFAALIALPCLVMMGAMAWMMVRMARHGGSGQRG